MKLFQRPFSGNSREVYIPVVLTAIVLRCAAFWFYLGSPLRYFHRVPGLDMMTLLEFGEWGVSHPPFFTLHRMVVAALWRLNGCHHVPELLTVLQMGGGVAVAWLTAWSVLHLTGRRRLALGCGLLAALYAPALLYECTTLQESVVTLALWASVAGVIAAGRRRCTSKFGFLAGVLLGLASIGRPTALLWSIGATLWCGWRSFHRGGLRRGIRAGVPVAAGMLALWLLIAGLNWYGRSVFSPFFDVLPYSAEVNAPVGEDAGGDGGKVPASRLALLCRIGWNAVGRLPILFAPREIPDNLNYYFIREEFPPLAPLPGPEPVMVLALAGMLMLVGTGRFRKGEGVFLLVTMLLALPLCANYPMGRYRLILYPAWSFFALWPWSWALEKRYPGRGIRVAIAAVVLLAASMPWWLNRGGARLRSSDFVAWALASEEPEGHPNEASMEFLMRAFRSGNRAAFSNLVDRLVQMMRLDLADHLVEEALSDERMDRSLPLLYRGIFRLAEGRATEALAALSLCDKSELGGEGWRLDFLRGEALRRLGRREEAVESLRRALSAAPAVARRMIADSLASLEER